MTDTLLVYVVDDDPRMRASLERLFRAAAIGVKAYDSASSLLAESEFAPGGVMLLDVMMPGMNGLELQKALCERGVTLPVLFLTGSGDVPMAVEAMRNGAADFLEKPFDNADLVDHVRHAFAKEEAAKRAPHVDSDFERRRATLTPREREVLAEMITGKTSKAIARDLGASFRTIEVHRAHVMDKLEVKTLAQLVRMSLEAELGL